MYVYRQSAFLPHDPRGAFERFADAHPTIFGRPFAINGIGLRYLDFHDRRADDGAYNATLWLVLAGLPIAPVRCERVRVGEHRALLPVERLPLAAARLLRTYALYAFVFVPLATAPVFALIAAAIHRLIDGGAFWLCALACFVWGIAVVAGERRVMGPPRQDRVRLR